MLNWFLRAVAQLPLSWLHVFGAALGWVIYFGSRKYAARLNANLTQSGLFSSPAEYRKLRRAAIAEAGKAAVEVIVIWLRPEGAVTHLIRDVRNFALVDAARNAGQGILVLSPHLGCFEMVGFFFGQKMPFTVLYRPPRVRWLEPLMILGRCRGQVELAATNFAGVRRVLRALRAGKAVGILPDQAPQFGEGVWAPFFGRPALTMTLSTRLCHTTNCVTLMVFAERLPRGAGYRIHIEPLPGPIGDEAQLNQAVERLIRQRPEQFIWGYDRYKVPPGVAGPGRNGAGAAS